MSSNRTPKLTQESSADVIEFPAQAPPKVSGAKARTEWLDELTRNYKSMKPLNFAMAVRLGAVYFNCTTGQCNPGYPTLARDLGCTVGSAKRAARELEQDGLIKRHSTEGGDHDNKTQMDLLRRVFSADTRAEWDGCPKTGGRVSVPAGDGCPKTGGTGVLVGRANEQLNRKEEQEEQSAALRPRSSARVERGDAPMNGAPSQLDEVLQSYPYASEQLRQTIASALRSGMTPAQIYAATPIMPDDEEVISAIRLHLPPAPAYATGLTHASSR
ncbi:helix-turn-helix domain-containing protein [Bradyrhizobium oligotrophicum]|uniref:helix-turn-helix domain-containing protein n=1 Tax=Bradyrhizobium TaxID=374 RepID=UPI003EB84F70